MVSRVGFLLFLCFGVFPSAARCAEYSEEMADCRALIFNYSAYDSAYAIKLKKFLAPHLPTVEFKDFHTGKAADLEFALTDCNIALLPYPSKGDSRFLKSFGMVLRAFVRRGGTVVLTGSHDFDVLQQLNLFELDYATFIPAPKIQKSSIEHPILNNLPTHFSLVNYAYPLDVSDPEFVSLADVNGAATVGFKKLGKGVVVYLGMEYYYDEYYSTQMLVNTFQWGSQFLSIPKKIVAEKPINRPKRVTLRLKPEEYPAYNSFNLNIYPNPFYERADLELSIGDPTPVSIDITDHTGKHVAVMLDRKTLGVGKHVLELPYLNSGVYFVKIKCGNTTTTRKILKISTQ